MKRPNSDIQTLEQHIEYVKGDENLITRLEICYYLYYPLNKAYDDSFWE